MRRGVAGLGLAALLATPVTAQSLKVNKVPQGEGARIAIRVDSVSQQPRGEFCLFVTSSAIGIPPLAQARLTGMATYDPKDPQGTVRIYRPGSQEQEDAMEHQGVRCQGWYQELARAVVQRRAQLGFGAFLVQTDSAYDHAIPTGNNASVDASMVEDGGQVKERFVFTGSDEVAGTHVCAFSRPLASPDSVFFLSYEGSGVPGDRMLTEDSQVHLCGQIRNYTFALTQRRGLAFAGNLKLEEKSP